MHILPPGGNFATFDCFLTTFNWNSVWSGAHQLFQYKSTFTDKKPALTNPVSAIAFENLRTDGQPCPSNSSADKVVRRYDAKIRRHHT